MLLRCSLKNLGCLPNVYTHAVCGVYVRSFPSTVLYLCSNVFGFLTFVAILMVFLATCSIRFLVCASIVLCTPLYLKLSLSLASSITLGPAPVFCCGVEFDFCNLFGICGLVFPFSLIETLSSDHLCRSCMISAGNGGFVRFFLSKHACLAFSPI